MDVVRRRRRLGGRFGDDVGSQKRDYVTGALMIFVVLQRDLYSKVVSRKTAVEQI